MGSAALLGHGWLLIAAKTPVVLRTVGRPFTTLTPTECGRGHSYTFFLPPLEDAFCESGNWVIGDGGNVGDWAGETVKSLIAQLWGLLDWFSARPEGRC